MASAPAALLDSWLSAKLKPEDLAWLREQCRRVATTVAADSERALFVAFGASGRRAGKDDLALSPAELAVATASRPDWNPRTWTRDQAARALLVLALPSGDRPRYLAVLDKLFACGDLHELIALYQCLPLLPGAESHRGRAAEGVRNNIKAVFEAVALDNPYAGEQLDEGAWNQLVLKALFVGSPLHRIVGLDRRANATLTRMLCDFAHERWAAKRTVPTELWRPVGRCADAAALKDLERVLAGGDERERRAAALALASCPLPGAKALLAGHSALAAALSANAFGWADVAQP